MRKLIPDLTPNQAYAIKFRLNNGSTLSPWSNVIRFETASDGVAPAQVTGLTLGVSGSSFVAEWDDVTLNEDGSELSDFRDYEIAITAGGATKRYFSIQSRFDITYDVNRGAFGNASPNISVTVKARDRSGNTVLVGATKSASNPPPPGPLNTEAKAFGDSIQVKWDEVIVDDFKEYQVWQSFDQTNWTKVWVGSSISAFIDTTQYVTHYFKVRAADVFDQYGEGSMVSATPLVQFGVDTEGPDTPTSLVLTPNKKLLAGNWVYHITADWSDATEADFSHYEYRYSLAGENEWQYGMTTDSNIVISGLAPATAYDVQARAFDLSGNPSLWAFDTETTDADENAPNKPSVPVVSGDTHSFLLTHDLKDYLGVLLEDDVAFLRVYSGPTGFTPNASNYLGEISVSPPSINAVAGGKFARPVTSSSGSTATVYVKVIAVDRNGNESVPSDQASVTLNLIANANIADATIGDAKIIDLAADKIKANSAFVNNLDIQSKITVKVGGTIESSNYSFASKTGYQIAQNSLTMFDGTIAAKSIELQESSANLMPAGYALFDYNGSWYSAGTSLVIDSLVTATQDSLLSRFGDTSLKIVNTGGATTKNVHLAKATDVTGYNIVVEPNTEYILSMYVRANQNEASGVFAIGYQGDVTGQSYNNVTTISGQWTRVFWKFNSGTNQKIFVSVKMTQSGTWNVDGVQLEPVLGKLTTPSIFKLPGVTKIDGRSIVTGEISSSQITDNVLPAWSINLQGNAMLNDVWMRGKVIVGGVVYSPETQAGMAIQSYNYVAGTSGWAIKGDGSVEFADGAFRGTILGAEIIGASYKTAETDRRIEMGIAGNTGKIEWIAPSGTKSVAQSFTSSADFGSTESFMVGITITNSHSQWNSMQIVDDERVYVSSRLVALTFGGASANPSKAFVVKHASNQGNTFFSSGSDRIYISETATYLYYRPTGGGMAFRQYEDETGINSDTRLHLTTDGGINAWINDSSANGLLVSETLADDTSRTRFKISSNGDNIFGQKSGRGTYFNEFTGATGASWLPRFSLDPNGSNYQYAKTGGGSYLFERRQDQSAVAMQGNLLNEWDYQHYWYSPRHSGDISEIRILGRPVYTPETHYRSPRLRFFTQQTGIGLYGAHVKFECLFDGSGQFLVISDSTDSGYQWVKAAGFDVASDESLKQDIRELDFSPLKKMRKAQPRVYSRKRHDGAPLEMEVGFLAGELKKVAPELVHGEEGDYSINVYGTVAMLVGSLNEVADELDAVRSELAQIKANNKPEK